MKRQHALAATAATTMTMLLTGCIDNGYDLTDIDTTSEIKVNDLTLPVNLAPVTLSDIIAVGENEDDKVKEVTINGKTFYAVEETGSFSSDPLRIDPFSAAPDPIYPTSAEFALTGPAGAKGRRRATADAQTYTLTAPVEKKLDYRADGIDKAIHSVTYTDLENLRMAFVFRMDGPQGIAGRELRDMSLRLPKGLRMADAAGRTYDAATGTMTIASLPLDANGRGTLELNATGIDLAANGTDIDHESHSLLLDSHFTIDRASLVLTPAAGTTPADMPRSVTVDVSYELGTFNATAISGAIEYDLEGEGLDMAPIELNDLPEFLAQDKTNLILHNPQIYLSVSNPLGADRLDSQTGMRLTALRDNQQPEAFTLDRFTIGHSRGEGPYNFCLSPVAPADVPEEYRSGMEHVGFASLSNVLSGKGLPKSIGVDLISPKVPMQNVAGFRLGRDLPRMEGTYRLLAPLALTGDAHSGSVIYYTDRKDGWNDEDIDAIVISTMKLTTEVSSTLPLNAVLTAHPLDKDGRVIDGVSVTGGNIPANAQDVPVELTMTGTVEHLDGIEFTAEVRPDGSSATLAPSQSMTLKKIRITVGGTYTKKF